MQIWRLSDGNYVCAENKSAASIYAAGRRMTWLNTEALIELLLTGARITELRYDGIGRFIQYQHVVTAQTEGQATEGQAA